MDTDQLLDRISRTLREEPVPEFVGLPPVFRPAPAIHKLDTRLIDASDLIKRQVPRRWLMASAAFATVAAIIVAALILFPAAHPSVAFGDVQDAVAAFASLRYRTLSFWGEADPHVSSIIWSRGKGLHAEGSNGSEQITNVEARRMLWLDHRSRKATLYQIYLEDETGCADEFNDRLRHLPRDAKALGAAKFNGNNVLQFSFSLLGEYVVLVDPGTKLPLRMELKLDQGPGRPSFREVITDFVFDAPVNESLFELKVPPEYSFERCEEPADRKAIDTRELILSPTKGVGDVPMKASKEKVIAFFGSPDMVEVIGRSAKVSSAPGKAMEGRHEVVFERLTYNSLGFEATVSSVDGMTEFRCFSNQGPIARRFLGRTDKGIRLGASIDEIIKAYGAPEVKTHFRDDSLFYFHKGWRFLFADETLVSFSITEPMSDQIEIVDNGDGSWIERVKAK
ncbi:MAG TPA: hypothetical protein VFI31_11175 [Pirellulales bacterium]|nr:hypothetical protein [Pirellulales bacterium]